MEGSGSTVDNLVPRMTCMWVSNHLMAPRMKHIRWTTFWRDRWGNDGLPVQGPRDRFPCSWMHVGGGSLGEMFHKRSKKYRYIDTLCMVKSVIEADDSPNGCVVLKMAKLAILSPLAPVRL